MNAVLTIATSISIVLATHAQAQQALSEGKVLFEQQCGACHNFEANGIGPFLGQLFRDKNTYKDKQWVKAFISDPKGLADAGDERAMHVTSLYPAQMPAFNLSASQLEAIIEYLQSNQTASATQRPNAFANRRVERGKGW
ncbi:c-type cytochrome [Ningiella sp. W23]|uniref:c-type cytochrome n=1 Tax=Ningiella sp. W23 TaxID=3023715 RepID=UPI0037575525